MTNIILRLVNKTHAATHLGEITPILPSKNPAEHLQYSTRFATHDHITLVNVYIFATTLQRLMNVFKIYMNNYLHFQEVKNSLK